MHPTVFGECMLLIYLVAEYRLHVSARVVIFCHKSRPKKYELNQGEGKNLLNNDTYLALVTQLGRPFLIISTSISHRYKNN